MINIVRALNVKPKRNDKCPCGSGQKFKKCCLERNEAKQLSLNDRENISLPTSDEIAQLVTAINEGHYIELERLALKLLEQYPNSGIVWKVLGASLYSQGKGATTVLQKALKLLPEDSEAHNNFGNALHREGKLDDAVASYRRAIELNPDFIVAHNNLGNVLKDLGQYDDAVTSFLCALKIQPDHVESNCNLGKALMYLGKMDAAERFLSKSIELAPYEAVPIIALLELIPYRQDDARYSHLEEVYAKREALPLEMRTRLNFCMGKAMENAGQYDRSFSAYEEGNRLHKQKHPFDEAVDEYIVEESCRYFTSDLLKKYATLEKSLPELYDERMPIFIVGMPRSGTTLIEQLLCGHPDIFGAGELTTLDEIVKKADFLFHHAETTNLGSVLMDLRKLGQEYLDLVWKLSPASRYITNKLPGNYHYLGLIHLMLPNARIIHSIRNPMDTCFSCYSLQFASGHEYSYDLEALGRQYVRYKKLMKHWRNILRTDRILDIRYEDIILDTERETRRMLDYLGLSWNSDCLKFYESKRAIRTASIAQVRKPIYSSSVARWKSFEKYLGPLLEIINAGQS